MSFLGILGGIGSVLGGLGGLFNKPKNVSSGQNLMSLAQGARDASAATGFNPLTLLQAGSGTTGYTTGGTPPLASVELITGGLSAIDDVTSGAKARRDAAEALNLDMARLRYDQARSGVIVAPLSQADTIGGTLSPLGSKAVQVYAADGQVFGGRNGSFSAVSPAPAVRNGGGSDGLDGIQRPTSVVVHGLKVNPERGYSDVQAVEDRYGEFVSLPYGLAVAAADGWKNYREMNEAASAAEVLPDGKRYGLSPEDAAKVKRSKDDKMFASDKGLTGRRHAYDWKKKLLKQSQGN